MATAYIKKLNKSNHCKINQKTRNTKNLEWDLNSPPKEKPLLRTMLLLGYLFQKNLKKKKESLNPR